MMKDCIVGTMSIPDSHTPRQKKADFGFVIYNDTLIFIDDSDFVEKQLDGFVEVQIMNKTSAPHILFEFFEFIINGSMNILYEYQENLQKLEDKVVETETFDSKKQFYLKRTFCLQKEKFQFFQNYYQQLIDLGTYIKENQNGMLSNSDCRLFSLFVQRIDRYYDMTLNLKEVVTLL